MTPPKRSSLQQSASSSNITEVLDLAKWMFEIQHSKMDGAVVVSSACIVPW